jgi:hypothetical protein
LWSQQQTSKQAGKQAILGIKQQAPHSYLHILTETPKNDIQLLCSTETCCGTRFLAPPYIEEKDTGNGYDREAGWKLEDRSPRRQSFTGCPPTPAANIRDLARIQLTYNKSLDEVSFWFITHWAAVDSGNQKVLQNAH